MSFIKMALSESYEYYISRVDRDIECNRKGHFSVTVLNNGQPVRDADISYRLKRHDFDFGSYLFMLNQYEDPERQETYLSEWKRQFNTVVVQLYWEGTEPERGVSALFRRYAQRCVPPTALRLGRGVLPGKQYRDEGPSAFLA